MSVEYFLGRKKILDHRETMKRKREYYDIEIFRYWSLHTRTECMCGDTKNLTIEKKFGISNEYFKKVNTEIGAVLNTNLASISSKISEDRSEKLTIHTEQRNEEQNTIKSPPCGKRKIEIYQLKTEWLINVHKIKRHLILKTEEQNKIVNIVMDENQWHFNYELIDPLPECGPGCIPKFNYDKKVVLETEHGKMYLPGKITDNSISIYGLDNTYKKGDVIKISDIPIEASPNFISNDYEARVRAIEDYVKEYNNRPHDITSNIISTDPLSTIHPKPINEMKSRYHRIGQSAMINDTRFMSYPIGCIKLDKKDYSDNILRDTEIDFENNDLYYSSFAIDFDLFNKSKRRRIPNLNINLELNSISKAGKLMEANPLIHEIFPNPIYPNEDLLLKSLKNKEVTSPDEDKEDMMNISNLDEHSFSILDILLKNHEFRFEDVYVFGSKAENVANWEIINKKGILGIFRPFGFILSHLRIVK